MEDKKPLYKVFAQAFIWKDGKFLIAKRPENKKILGGYWELPGGRVESSESLENATKREIMEELGVEIDILSLVDAFTYNKFDHDSILLTFVARITHGEIQLLDHDEVRWITIDQVDDFKISWEAREKSIKKGWNFASINL